jgi:predicted aspartyl protease
MILGGLDDLGRPLVRIKVRGAEDELLCLVDTGFNGKLWMGAAVATRLKIVATRTDHAALTASGKVENFSLGMAFIDWLGDEQRVEVHVHADQPSRVSSADQHEALIGTALLRDTTLLIEFTVGTVQISPAPNTV